MFYAADDRYRAQFQVSCRNALHTVFKVPYARSAGRPKEATEVASQNKCTTKRRLEQEKATNRAASDGCALRPSGAQALHPSREQCGLSRPKGL